MTQPWGQPPNPYRPSQPPQQQGGAPAWPQRASFPPPAPGQQPVWPVDPRAAAYGYAPGYAPRQQTGWGVAQPASWPPPVRRRRRGPFGALVRIISFVTFGFIVLSTLSNLMGGIDLGPTTTNAPTLPSGTSGGTAEGSDAGTGGAAGSDATTYQNEDYQAPPADMSPPDLPVPRTSAEAKTWLTSNALYNQVVPSPTHCTMQPISGATSNTKLESDLNDEMACLMAVWEPPLKAAGFALPRPPVNVYSTRVTTACGVMKEVNAAYCAGDQRVYYSARLLTSLPSSVARTTYAAETIIAHEFGHAVQARSGILAADNIQEERASSADARVLSRRLEQQADCFGGLYVGSVARSQGLTQAKVAALAQMNVALGDDTLTGNPDADEGHGSGVNRKAWWSKGVATTSVGACNTWTAPTSQVR